MSDHDDAQRYALEAGAVLLALRADEPEPAASLGSRADRAANEVILGLLGSEHPGDTVLSEESPDDGERRRFADRVWIVDPLDGTREYCEAGRTDWAVHVALWARNRGVRAAAVALPARGLVFGTSHPLSVPPHEGRVRLAVSRSRAPHVTRRVAEALDAELVPLGSAGAKTMAVIEGVADAYVHAGGQYEWDSAAPTAVAAAAGLHVCRLDGSPLAYNQPSPWLPDLVVCRVELRAAILAVTAEAAGS